MFSRGEKKTGSISYVKLQNKRLMKTSLENSNGCGRKKKLIKSNINWRSVGKYTALTAQMYFLPFCICTACSVQHAFIPGQDYNWHCRAWLHRALGQREFFNQEFTQESLAFHRTDLCVSPIYVCTEPSKLTGAAFLSWPQTKVLELK